MTAPKHSDRAIVASNRLNSVVEAFRQDALMDAAITQAASRAPEYEAEVARLVTLTADELRAEGWTKATLNIARHALMSSKDAPIYLRMAHERYVARLRLLPTDEGKGSDSTAVTIVIPAAQELPPVAPDDDDGGDP